jgi:hypothetical protein
MHEPAGSRPSSVSFLQLFSWVTIAGAIFLHTAPCLRFPDSTPKSNQPVAEEPSASDKTAVRVLVRGKMQRTKPRGVTRQARVQPFAAEARVQPYEDFSAPRYDCSE